jgi:uncharacterized protein YxjI
MADAFERQRYMIRKKIFKLFGEAFHVFDPASGEVILYAEQRAFRLKEDFTVFADVSKAQPLLRITARQVLDISGTYDILDARTGEPVGACRRRGLRSMVRDSWEVFDASAQPLAQVDEDSLPLALVRRFLSDLVPQSFHVTDYGGQELARFKQYFNPFVFKMELDFSPDSARKMDRRLGLGLAVCMTAIEGRQD